MSRFCCVVLSLLALPATGCLDDPAASPDKADFVVVCTEDDATCTGSGYRAPLPAKVAVGAALQVAYGPEQSPVPVRPASPFMAQTDGLFVRFTAKGYCALLARTEAGTVVDLQHVLAVPAEALSLEGPESLAPQEAAELVAEPRGPDGESLAGSLTYAWSTSDPSVVAIDTSAHGNRVKILGVGAGVATIRAAAAAYESTLEVTVSEAP